MLFKDGRPVETMVGAMPKSSYEARLNKYLKS
jgi:thioredoxin-like negative regulator of GroEL